MQQNITNSYVPENNMDAPKFLAISLINKKIVHKNNTENVHIYNFRRSIPKFITAQKFEIDLANSLTPDDFRFISKYYTKISIKKNEAGQNSNYSYTLKSLPLKIKIEEFENKLSEMNGDNKSFVLEHYIKVIEEGNYAFTGPLNDLEELRLANIFNVRSNITTDSEKALISAVLDKVDTLEREDVFYANMYANPCHPYFFEHKLDHVPGMMLIETARQIFYSCYHVYGNTPIDGVEFILSDMNVNFIEYIWMSYPTRIMLEISEKSSTDEGYWKKCSCDISFHQEHKVKAIAKLGATNIKKSILDVIISKKEMKKAVTSNNEIPGFQSKIYLKDTSSNIGFFGSILDVSQKHILAEFRIPIIFDTRVKFHFNIDLEKSVYSLGKCTVEWQQVNDEMCVARFLMSEVDSKNMDHIVRIINRLRSVREEKKII